MDRKFGPMGGWHAIAGQSFAYEVTHEVSRLHGRLHAATRWTPVPLPFEAAMLTAALLHLSGRLT